MNFQYTELRDTDSPWGEQKDYGKNELSAIRTVVPFSRTGDRGT